MQIKKNRKKGKGIVFWVTGFPGSGKTAIAKTIKRKIEKKYGPTILLSGHDIRKAFNYKKYKRKDRINFALKYGRLFKKITDQGLNIILAVVILFDSVRKWNRSNFNNYIEIFIQSDIEKIIKLKKKYFFKRKIKNVWGKDIKPQFPRSPDIIIKNDFKKTIKKLSNELFEKITKIIKTKSHE